MPSNLFPGMPESCQSFSSNPGPPIPLHTVILGPIIRGQPKTNLKVTFEQEGKQIRYSKYHIKLM